MSDKIWFPVFAQYPALSKWQRCVRHGANIQGSVYRSYNKSWILFVPATTWNTQMDTAFINERHPAFDAINYHVFRQSQWLMLDIITGNDQS